MRLVRRPARRYAYTSEPLDDLVQVGSVGLLQALSRYDEGVHPPSQSEIGRRLGVSQMHVSRLMRRALARMQAIAVD